MTDPTVTLSIGGLDYRVQTDAQPETLQHLARIVDARVANCNPKGRLSPAQALLYAALTLADDLENEKRRRSSLENDARRSLHDVLTRIDAALAAAEPFLAPP